MMQYINKNSLDYPVTEYQIKQVFRNVSFPKNFVAPEPFAPVEPTSPPIFDKMTKRLQELTPVQKDGIWNQAWEVVSLSDEEIAKNQENARNANKSQATYLLAQTDWVELNDVSNPNLALYLTNKADFTTYRQALRMIAVNPPIVVDEWPLKPTEIWSN